MNVLVLNEQQNQLQNIEIDLIKSITGSFQASEIVGMFKDFFFNKMVLDVTALKDYQNPETYKELTEGLNPDKVIFYLPEGSDLCTSGFLSRLISIGIYNFTTNIDGVIYLINNTNSYKDVAHIQKMAGNEETEQTTQNDTMPPQVEQPVNQQMPGNNMGSPVSYNQASYQQPVQQPAYQEIVAPLNDEKRIIGIQNVTDGAGSTSLIYMMKKELTSFYSRGVYAIEIDKCDFISYNDKTMFSTSKNDLESTIRKVTDAKIILIDLNNQDAGNICNEIVYLIEPSVIKLNKLMKRNKSIIATLRGKKVVLNKSLLTGKEVSEFEFESGLNITYNMPPLNDRKRNEIIVDFMQRLNIISNNNDRNSQTGIFGLFRK